MKHVEVEQTLMLHRSKPVSQLYATHYIMLGKSLTLSEPLRFLQETRITVMLNGYLSLRTVGF